MTIGDNTRLSGHQRRKVLEKVGQRNFTCGSCGARDFEVGNALYLGFLFRSEDRDDYMVALTCKNPDCEAPRTGVRLHEAEFLRQEWATETGER
jgi:hypothetical protein